MNQTQHSLPSLLDESPSPERAVHTAGRRSLRFSLNRNSLMLYGSAIAMAAATVVLAWQLFGGPPSAATLSRQRNLICSETGESFPKFTIPENPDTPLKNPKTGRMTLYPAEACYWNKDGTARLSPTYVLLNSYVGKGGPTICPDCGRIVVGHNPRPPGDLLLQAAEREGKLKPAPPADSPKK